MVVKTTSAIQNNSPSSSSPSPATHAIHTMMCTAIMRKPPSQSLRQQTQTG